eukprot:SAG11_NODE_2005_length_3930_cov_28.915166_3_plen_107_part_00
MVVVVVVMGQQPLGLGGPKEHSGVINVTMILLVIMDVLVAIGATFIDVASIRGCTPSGTNASTIMSVKSGTCFMGASHRFRKMLSRGLRARKGRLSYIYFKMGFCG